MSKTYEELVKPTTELTIGSLILFRDTLNQYWQLGRLIEINTEAEYPYTIHNNLNPIIKASYKYAVPYNELTACLEGTDKPPHEFKEGDAVLCKDYEECEWWSYVFSHKEDESSYPFVVYDTGGITGFRYCIPFDADKIGTV